MISNWDHYLCRLDDDPASIYLDLGFVADTPLATHPTSVAISVTMLRPQQNGLSSDDEFTDLIAIEDDLSARLGSDGALYIGRLTARRCRVFYFYTADPASLEHNLKTAMTQHPAYLYRISNHADPAWSVYSDFLFPSPDTRQRMKKR